MSQPTDLFSLQDKTAVVTGGAGLLGKAFVEILAQFGAKVIVADNNKDQGCALEAKWLKAGLAVRTASIDITDEKSIDRFFEAFVKEEGTLDIWVNNAYPRTADWGKNLEELKYASWKSNVDMHLNSYCWLAHRAAQLMKKNKRGSVINIASIYGEVGPDFSIYDGTTLTMPAAYAAIKGGIINFTRYLASYYGSSGVRVNCLSPGGILDGQPEKFVENYSLKTPLKRMGTPEDMVGALVFLASEASSYVTGQNLIVDGGWTSI